MFYDSICVKECLILNLPKTKLVQRIADRTRVLAYADIIIINFFQILLVLK